MASELGGVLYIALVIFGLVLLVCWIVLPFALIGTKSILRELVHEQRRTNLLLEQLAAARGQAPSPSVAAPERPAVTVDRRYPPP